MKPKYWWIKERHNPQLGVYYVAVGNITTKEAKSYEGAGYGTNIMHKYASEDSYHERVEQLIEEGHEVQI